MLGIQFGHLLGGAVIVESVFAWPGVGRLVLQAVLNRDYLVVQGTLLLLVLSFIGKMKIFDLVWITTKGGPLWSTETVSTYLYKRAFEWTTFDLGYPSTIATVWFAIVLAAVLGLTWLFRQRERLEY